MKPVRCKSIAAAFILSLLIPGLGTMYLGKIGRGMGLLVVALFFAVVVWPALLILWPLFALDAAFQASSITECPVCRIRVHHKALQCPACATEYAR